MPGTQYKVIRRDALTVDRAASGAKTMLRGSCVWLFPSWPSTERTALSSRAEAEAKLIAGFLHEEWNLRCDV